MPVYQNIELNGIDIGEGQDKKYSKFCNEGKWDNFINPLLPEDCQERTFVEMGCNAGLFLKMAKEKGFDRVIGVEASRSAYKVGLEYKAQNGLNYEIMNQTIGEGFVYDLPMADVTVMSNFHYHLDFPNFYPLIDRMRFKTIYCLVVSARVTDAHWKPSWQMNAVRHYFKDWQEIKAVYPIEVENDPHSREEMYGILFKSPLERVNISDIWNKKDNGKYVGNDIPTNEFARQVIENESFDFMESNYYKAVYKMRESKWKEDKIIKFVKAKYDLMYSIKRGGLKSPIYLRLDNKIADGGHRKAMIEELGYKSIIARRV